MQMTANVSDSFFADPEECPPKASAVWWILALLIQLLVCLQHCTPNAVIQKIKLVFSLSLERIQHTCKVQV